jgi:subtilase family protein
MATTSSLRQYVVVDESYPLGAGDLQQAAQALLDSLLPGLSGYLNAVAVPSDGWRLFRGDPLVDEALPAGDTVISVGGFADADAVDRFRSAIADANRKSPPPFVAVSADLAASEADFFCPATIDQLLFGDRATARLLTHAPFLAQQGLTGREVNVVVIDQGFDRTKVRHFGGGWGKGTIVPGTTTRGHGPMMVRNVVDAAPDAIFWDLPLIPLAIDDINAFTATAYVAFRHLLHHIAHHPGRWVLVNAWAIYDRSTEYPLGDYTQNPANPLNVMIGRLAARGGDVIFAAGNCGQFGPDLRCGRVDRGPGHSIWGGNSHPDVVTTGAVRTDALWLGSSSQGPGQPLLDPLKPDLCAPGNFRDAHDAALGNTAEPFVGKSGTPYFANTGTSAASGLTAGIVAAIRQRWDQAAVTPARLKQVLNQFAHKPQGPSPNPDRQLGNGIINAEDTLNNLP